MRMIALMAFVLTGCTSHHLQRPARAGNTYLVCGSAVRLDISHDGRSAIVRDERGRETLLPRADSSLGTRYEGSDLTVHRSGDTYLYFDRDGASLACDPLPRGNVLQRGAEFALKRRA